MGFNTKYGDLPTASKTGHRFLGWFTERVGGEDATKETTLSTAGGKTLYAHWAIGSYTVTFDFNNGTTTTAVFEFDETIVYPETGIEREGYSFNGWTPKLK